MDLKVKGEIYELVKYVTGVCYYMVVKNWKTPDSPLLFNFFITTKKVLRSEHFPIKTPS